jgi:citrate lyase subunit beta/citryl-CoA lyase
LGIEETAQALLFYRSQLVYISKILNIKQPIGGVYKNIKDFEGLQKFARNIKEIGFEGMQAIHPGQVEIIDAIFKPTLDEINEAEELLRDIELNDKKGIGVFVDSNGSIVDAAMIMKAKKIINQSE